MFDNHFTKRYKSIPIARFTYTHTEKEGALFLTPPELHKEFEIILITEGSAVITINNALYNANAGDLFLISPYMLHSVKLSEYTHFKHICHCFDLSLLPDNNLRNSLASQRLFIKPCISSDSSYNASLCNKFLNIDSALTNEPQYWELTAQSNLMLLFVELMTNNLYTNISTNAYNKDFCVNVIDFLEIHYHEKITSRTIAEHLHFTQSYFCRIFKKNFNMSFADYLNAYRIEKSKNLLSNRSLSITDVAYKSGFSDTSYFIKVFRQQNHIPPQKFRETYM